MPPTPPKGLAADPDDSRGFLNQPPPVSQISAGLLVWLLVVFPRPMAAQNVTATGIDADLDGALTGIAVSVSPHAQIMHGGEAFESLNRGHGASAALTAYLGQRYALRGRFAATRNGEGYTGTPDRTTTLDVLVEVRWILKVVGLELEAGPTFGYARMSRPLYVLPIHGFVAGLGVGASRPLIGGFSVIFGVDASWTSFSDPPIALPAPQGFERDAKGNRVLATIGLSHRWSTN